VAPTAPIVSTTWDYGDGQQGTSASHTYSTPGTYTVRVTVTDSLNRQATAVGKVTVDLPAAPVVSIGNGPDSFAWHAAHFSVASALGAGTTVTSEAWDYGDGQSGATSSHTYKAPGTYNVGLTITDSLGRQAQASRQVVVQPCGNAGMVAAGSSTPTTVCVHVQTTAGDMVFELDTVKAPVTTTNFLKYVDAGFYSGTLFHRIIKGFMAQGGGFKAATGGMVQLPTFSPITLESNNTLQNKAYTLAMARLSDPNYNSATSQFFINFIDNAFLNYSSASKPGYAVFGKVIAGQPAVDSLATVNTGSGPVVDASGNFLGNSLDVPTSPVVIKGMSRIP
jgi:cyclophilin family peptidyl-prolyl cis-trans isomerase/plastocyanin